MSILHSTKVKCDTVGGNGTRAAASGRQQDNKRNKIFNLVGDLPRNKKVVEEERTIGTTTASSIFPCGRRRQDWLQESTSYSCMIHPAASTKAPPSRLWPQPRAPHELEAIHSSDDGQTQQHDATWRLAEDGQTFTAKAHNPSVAMVDRCLSASPTTCCGHGSHGARPRRRQHGKLTANQLPPDSSRRISTKVYVQFGEERVMRCQPRKR